VKSDWKYPCVAAISRDRHSTISDLQSAGCYGEVTLLFIQWFILFFQSRAASVVHNKKSESKFVRSCVRTHKINKKYWSALEFGSSAKDKSRQAADGAA
jgi:hypothetical protein